MDTSDPSGREGTTSAWRRTHRLAALLTLSAGLLAAWGAAAVAAAPGTTRAGPAVKPGAQATPSVKRTICSSAPFAGSRLLGPKRLPNAGPVARLLRGWKRLAGFSPRGYLKRFYDEVAKSWRYPPEGGYQLTPLGVPVIGQVSLIEGQLIDRFGSEGGTYLSPQGTPYAARGIPPESLNPFPGGQPCNYYRYRVLKPFSVNSGPIAPTLGQPGFGLQYVLSSTLFAGVTERVDVSYLLSNGTLSGSRTRRRSRPRSRLRPAPEVGGRQSRQSKSACVAVSSKIRCTGRGPGTRLSERPSRCAARCRPISRRSPVESMNSTPRRSTTMRS
jgi:hypothetical protein